jgi:hypothetical protein
MTPLTRSISALCQRMIEDMDNQPQIGFDRRVLVNAVGCRFIIKRAQFMSRLQFAGLDVRQHP